MNENPASPPAPQPVPPPREVRVSLPASAPNVTYVIVGITVFVYILQLASVYFYGYAVNGVDWLELFGARINSFIRAGTGLAILYACPSAWLDSAYFL